MTTQDVNANASTRAPPSSQAGTASSDSERTLDVVYVTGGVATGEDEPWTASSARQTSDPPPLRATKRAPKKPATAADTPAAAARKGKKKPVKRAATGTSGAAPRRKSARVSAVLSDYSDLEDKAPVLQSAVESGGPEAIRLVKEAVAARSEVQVGKERPHWAQPQAAADSTLMSSTANLPETTRSITPAPSCSLAMTTPRASLSQASTGSARSASRPVPRPTPSATMVSAPDAASRSATPHTATPHRAGFNLESFMATFDPSVDTSESSRPALEPRSVPTIREAEPHELVMLREEVARLRRMLEPQPAFRGQLTAGTAPNAKGELPPQVLCFLSCSSYPEGPKKAKGEYNPPQAHLLAAGRMLKNFVSQEGESLSAMTYVLWIREAECIKFLVVPAVLMALFSGRLGSRGLTILHFREECEMDALEAGSNNANFASDYSPSAQLPPAPSRCDSYDDILDGIYGLAAFGNEFWFDHVRKITSRLRAFVSKNKTVDPNNTPVRVRLTLMYTNKVPAHRARPSPVRQPSLMEQLLRGPPGY